MTDPSLSCSECGMQPWDKHCCTCEPCVMKRIRAACKSLEEVNARLRENLDALGAHAEAARESLLSDKRRMDFLEQHNATCNRIGFYAGTLRQAIDAAILEEDHPDHCLCDGCTDTATGERKEGR